MTYPIRPEITVSNYCPEMWAVRLHGLDPVRVIRGLNGTPLPGYSFWEESYNEQGILELEPKSWDKPGISTYDGVLTITGYYEHEGDDRLDGTLPWPTEMTSDQLMDVAHITKKLLALAVLAS